MTTLDSKTYWESRLAASPGLEGVGYFGLGRYYNEWLYKVRRRVFRREVRRLGLHPKDVKVLDVGSGTGFYIDQWLEVGVSSVVGSDLTDVSVSRLRQVFSESKIILLDISAPLADPPSEQFDVISAFDVLFHITDDSGYEAAVSNIHSMLVPGGWFLLSDNFLCRVTQRAGHQVSRSLSEIASILQKAGFQIVRRRPMFVLMNYPVDTESRICKLLWAALTFPIYKSEILGYIIGAIVYPAECLLGHCFSEGPSTEIMICRKLP